jgi:phosphoglycolate phosphatase
VTGKTIQDREAGCVEIRPDFRWDGCDAYLFDIDGTLLHARGGVHMDAFSSSVLDVTGHRISLDRVVVHGNTDTGILRSAFHAAGIPDEEWEPQQEDILKRMCATVFERRSRMSVDVFPGVVETLAYLGGKGRSLGVATGNLEQIGWLKIELAGLREWFSFGSFSDRYALRSEMIRHGVDLARQVAGEKAAVCVVGDTPSDIAAAKANSLPTIAVATGVFSFDQLRQHAPEVCASSLRTLLEHSASES